MQDRRHSTNTLQVKPIRLLLLLAALFGCSGTLVPVRILLQDYILLTPDPKVVDIILDVAQKRNLNVAVIERQAGVIRLETATLTPTQLDTYCEYPYTRSDGRTPWDTFTNWDRRSQASNAGPVRGRVSLSLLVKPGAITTTINLRGNWTSYNKGESTPCTSTGIFEREFIADVQNLVAQLPQTSSVQQAQLNEPTKDNEPKKAVDTGNTAKTGKLPQEMKGSPGKPENSATDKPPEPARRNSTGVTTKDSEFDARAEFQGIQARTNESVFFIRSWLDKKTGEATHQLYVADVYSGNWKTWVLASDDRALSLKVVSIDRKVESCRYGSCIYTEHFGIELPDALLNQRRNAEYRIKIKARSGHEKILSISSEMMDAQLDEIENYRVQHKLYGRSKKPLSDKRGTPL